MKTNWFYSLMVCFSAMVLFSCQKEEDRAILEPKATPTLDASVTQVILTEENAGNEAVAFSWSPADFGYQAAVNYQLQFDSAGSNFAEPQTINLGNELDSTLTVVILNDIAMQSGLAPDTAGNLAVRLVAQLLTAGGVSRFVEPLYSEPVTLSVTPYSTVVAPGYLYVPGAYQGWNPATAARLISAENDGVYEGYITFPAEQLAFKFTPAPNWDLDYGDGGNGTLVERGADLTVPAAGSYLLQADLNEMTWSATPYSWGVIGNATGSWDVDQDMRYDYEQGAWTITLELVPGEIKFRLNDDWGTNYGDDNPDDDQLNAGGANIAIGEAGTYQIVLDVSDAEAPTYTITRQ